MFEEKDWEHYWKMTPSGRKATVEAMHPYTALHCASVSEDFEKELMQSDIQGCCFTEMYLPHDSEWILTFRWPSLKKITFCFCHPDWSDLSEELYEKEEKSWPRTAEGRRMAPDWVLMHGGDKVQTFLDTVDNLSFMFPSVNLFFLSVNLKTLPDKFYPVISGMDCEKCKIKGIEGDGDSYKIHEIIKSLKSIKCLQVENLPESFEFREPEKHEVLVWDIGRPTIPSITSGEFSEIYIYFTYVSPQMIVDFIKLWKQGTMKKFTRLHINSNKPTQRSGMECWISWTSSIRSSTKRSYLLRRERRRFGRMWLD